MIRCDALVVGGGPGGSTCARVLRRAGWEVVVADRARFPRDKVCAGWLTPGVFPLLELDPDEYRATGLTLQEIRAFRTSVIGATPVDTRYHHVASYAIRRCEFDDFLLRRAQAHVLEDTFVTSLQRSGGRWIVNGAIDAMVVIGAGGHFCPVARHLRGGADTSPPVVAKEAEFRVEGRHATTDGQMPELFFCRDLEGYGWCVRKGDYLNVGIGRRTSVDFNDHVRDFTTFLERTHTLSPTSKLKWRGHAYLASGAGTRPIVGDGMLLVGDAAGLAYAESGEGIGPAIASGRLAAETLIALNGRHSAIDLQSYADVLAQRYPRPRSTPARLKSTVAAFGRLLLGSRAFTRHIMLNRWFLRASCLALAAWMVTPSHVYAQRAASSESSLAARLQRFEDKEEIQNLLLDYGRYLDNRDFAGYSSLFAKDGEWVGGFGSVTGPANIKTFMEKNMGTQPNVAKNYHLLSNFVITVNGDTATAWSRWAFVVPGERGATIAQAGRYDDTLVRENGRWRFKKRVASNDTAGPGGRGK
ncbi:MAG TPA: FAD-dependent oxidoreductase [Vicinamibacterales bacterium]